MRRAVDVSEAGLRLDEFLASHLPQTSRMWLRTAIRREAARVNGVARTAGWRLRPGDAIELCEQPEGPSAVTPEPIPIRLHYEEEHLVVVEKPAGLVVHPAGRHRSGTLTNALAYHFGQTRPSAPVRPGIVHRLDRETSGLLVVACTQAALSRLTRAFQNHQVEKRYLALVAGRPAAETGIWEAPIGSDPTARPHWGIRPEGRPAATRYRVRERVADTTLLELEPITGRTNQLRLHCAHFGCPIVGDTLFGSVLAPGPGRLFLHAAHLAFPHPISGEWLVFQSELPEVLHRFLTR